MPNHLAPQPAKAGHHITSTAKTHANKTEGIFDGPLRFVEVQDLIEIRAVSAQKD